MPHQEGTRKNELFLRESEQTSNSMISFTMDLKSQIAVITGAGSGFGRAVANELDRQGCQLILCGRREDKLKETGEQLESGNKPFIRSMDVGSTVDVEALAQDVLREFQKVHILINNAGVFPENAPVQQTHVMDWDNTITTNLRGPYLLMRAFLPAMIKEDYGRIVNISAPLKHYPGAAGYCASKCALDSLTKAVAYENKKRNILVNAVEPPFMDTEMHTGGADPAEMAPKILPYLDPEETSTRGRVHKLE